MALGITKIERLENGNILLSVKDTVKKAFLPNVGLDTLSDTTVRFLDLNGANSYDFTWQTVKEFIVNGSSVAFDYTDINGFIRFIYTNIIFSSSGDLPTGLATADKQDTGNGLLEQIRDQVQTTENHVFSSASGSGPTTIPAGFYSVLIIRRSGNITVDGNVVLNNQVRTLPIEAQQTLKKIGGTPVINITGTGNWSWIAMNNLT